MSFQEVHYRPVFGRVLAVVTVVLCAVGAVAMIAADPASALRYVWPILLMGVLAWAVFWRPGLLVQEHGITVENVLSTRFVSWPSITAIDTRYSLTLQTTQGRIAVWAAPAPGRHRTLGLAAKDFDGVGESARGQSGELRPTDAITTPGGNLAQLIRGRWEQLRDAGAFASGVDPDAASTTWHWATITAVVVLTGASVIGLLV